MQTPLTAGELRVGASEDGKTPCERLGRPLRRDPAGLDGGRVTSLSPEQASGGGRRFWEPRLRCPLQGNRVPESPGSGLDVGGSGCVPGPATSQRAGRDSHGRAGHRAAGGQDRVRCCPQLSLSWVVWELPTVDSQHLDTLLLDSAVALGTAVFSLSVSLSLSHVYVSS